jgi:hypothetical protein
VGGGGERYYAGVKRWSDYEWEGASSILVNAFD